MEENISLKGVRVNNLKNISIDIPRDKFIAISGVSGSGKSSLAFDTLYAEGRRRYTESLSTYARQFLGKISKPLCDSITGLPPAIAIEQKTISTNPRSTVGTSTEIYDYLRILFARIGKTISPISGREVKIDNVQTVLKFITTIDKNTIIYVVAQVEVTDISSTKALIKSLKERGFARLFANNKVYKISSLNGDEDIFSNEVFVLIDRITLDNSDETAIRLADSIETAFNENGNKCGIVNTLTNNITFFSNKFEADGISFEKPTPNLFAFNSPLGACPECSGSGVTEGIDENLVVQDTTLSVYDGCILCWHGEKMGQWKDAFCKAAQRVNFPIFTPYKDLNKEEKHLLWHGNKSEYAKKEIDVCIDDFFSMLKENQYKIQFRVMLSRYKGKTLCNTCKGLRLRKEANFIYINNKNINDIVSMPIWQAKEWFDNITLDKEQAETATRILQEIRNRLSFLCNVGLDYLTLSRKSNTLSGGESQRIRLATTLGSPLMGSLYVLDEPSIGLHCTDNAKIVNVLKDLKDAGNTVVVVEHDEEIIRSADQLIDIGPKAGYEGGEIVYQGRTDKITKTLLKQYPHSETLRYLFGQEQIKVPTTRRQWTKSLIINNAEMNNLQNISVNFPLNVLTVITGVSGSGKSTLLKGLLYPLIKRRLGEVCDVPGTYSSFEGDLSDINHVELADQSPIGKSLRSTPATYIKAFDLIRRFFAEQPLAKQLNFSAQHFSFNTEGGRCETCKGAGMITVEMQFMADITLVCDSCKGSRYKKDVLEVKYNGKNISDVLNMNVLEAIDFFTEAKQTAIVKSLKPLEVVGLGYLKLGQGSSDLSGGESQRIRLASFIAKEKQEPTLFIFDEPTTGLHFSDVKRLLDCFSSLIEKGHSVFVIEHNLEVIKCADYLIDLGPGGGDKGGKLVACGTPEQVSMCKESATGQLLRDKLQ